MFAPYGGGRFLSLFRSKVDTLSIQYRDAEGDCMAPSSQWHLQGGCAQEGDVAQGAHTSIPVQDDAGGSDTKPAAAKEKKP